MRDDDKKRYLGKGVKKAIQNINELVNKEIINKQFESYRAFDKAILELDGTENKSKIGANATLAASLAFAKSLSSHSSKDFFKFISESEEYLLPVPMMNIVNGGSHADNDVDIQEFMIAPVGAPSFSEALRYGCEIFHSLKSILKSKNLNTNVGDEGGFAPNVNSSAEVIEIILSAVEKAGLKINDDILLSLDVASTEFYKDNKYELKGEGKTLSSEELDSAKLVAREIGITHHLIEYSELENENFVQNDNKRCFYCRDELSGELIKLSNSLGIKTIVDGTQSDDMGDYRPGIDALHRNGIRSPLLEVKFTKELVRKTAKHVGLSIYDKPSNSCLASRIPWGQRVTAEKLARIELSEKIIKQKIGVQQVRVRDINGLARIEVELDKLNLLDDTKTKNEIFSKLKILSKSIFNFIKNIIINTIRSQNS